MSCRQYRAAVMALARQAGEPDDHERARAHPETCVDCRQWLDEQQALTAGLRALAAASRDEQPSDALEGRLLAMFDAERAAPSTSAALQAGAWLRWWPAAAAAILAVGAVAWWQTAGRRPPPQPASTKPVTGIIEVVGFRPLPLAEALPDFESGEIVRTQITVTALPVYGIAIPPDPATAAVTVDLLVGQDGHPRAIRLVADESRDSRSR